MGMSHNNWARFAALRKEWEAKGWLLTAGWRDIKGRRWHFAAKRIITRSSLGDPVPFMKIEDLIAFLEAAPKELPVQPVLPAVIVIPAPARLVRRSR